MRKTILILLCIISATIVYAQDANKDHLIKLDSVSDRNAIKEINRYKLYPTPNMYNFLKLDTQTGIIYRVQWNLDSDKRLLKVVNPNRLISEYDEQVNGRFEVVLTENLYNFILLDKINGRVWQCQWNFDVNKNWIERIY